MDQLDQVKAWLQTFPQWGEATFFIDYLDGQPGSCGLYPVGAEELSRSVTVTGQVRRRLRSRFVLYRMGAADAREDALWLSRLQSWVARQSALGLAPRLGDDPAAESIRAEGGKLSKRLPDGSGKYTVTLIAEYKKYE